MSDPAYCIGVDFGTESGRVLLMDVRSGEQLAVTVVGYPSTVIDSELPGTGESLGHDWALQDPDDWVKVLDDGVPAVLEQAGVPGKRVVGLGIDFTSCTVLPVSADGEPLCRAERWRSRPHAWPKLWKHHAAQPVADRLNEVALERSEPFLERYGGRISSEWYFPKLIEVWLQDREVYDACDAFIEATDWIVWYLTGRECRQSCAAGYKAMWSQTDGLPPVEYFEAAYPGFDHPGEKLGTEFAPLATRAGTVRTEVSDRYGLSDSVAVAVGNVDSFVSFPGCGVSSPGVMVMTVGTSICQMVVTRDEHRLPGITGVVRDGILPGLYGYEAGQAAVGDMLAWYVKHLGAGADYPDLERAAAEVGPGESGLIALDWFNGNRSILGDGDLSGVLLGLTLRTRPGEIYRSLLESIAFGTRRIVENFAEEGGIELEEIVACGGIAEKSPMLMQMFADVTGLPVRVPEASEIPARGAALFGAVAAGVYDGIGEAIEATRPADAHAYEPQREATERYDRAYGVYRELYELLGRAQVGLLHELKRIRTGQEETHD